MFMCGGAAAHGPDECHVVGVGHLTDDDPTLNECADLPEGSEAERSRVGEAWLRSRTNSTPS
jgi:hypothetical protein